MLRTFLRACANLFTKEPPHLYRPTGEPIDLTRVFPPNGAAQPRQTAYAEGYFLDAKSRQLLYEAFLKK